MKIWVISCRSLLSFIADASDQKAVMVLFFFKQKTAYEMLRSLVGSEMCIRDRPPQARQSCRRTGTSYGAARHCLLYTSDAADEEDSVDLGGRRIIKKKKKNN